jgi:hypothetical protein
MIKRRLTTVYLRGHAADGWKKKQRKTNPITSSLLQELNKRLSCEKAVFNHLKVSNTPLHCDHVLNIERDCLPNSISGWSL